MIGRAREVRGAAVDCKDVARLVVAGTHPRKDRGVALGDRSELGMPVVARSGNIRHGNVVNHPSFIPPAFVVDHEQRRNVGEHIVEGARVVRIGR